MNIYILECIHPIWPRGFFGKLNRIFNLSFYFFVDGFVYSRLIFKVLEFFSHRFDLFDLGHGGGLVGGGDGPHDFRIYDGLARDTRQEKSIFWRWPAEIEEDKIQMDGYIREFIGSIGYMVLFWSSNSINSYYQQTDLKIAKKLNLMDRILFATLEQDVKHTVKTDLVVQLYSDEERSQINRIDDLIVRLYWLMYQNQYGNL